ncbi:MAG: O-linked N-acetylglucosamine transferase, SPINDLY family protein [Pseudohaliea sp.]
MNRDEALAAAEAQFGAGDRQAAAETLDRLLAREPDCVAALCNRGYLAHLAGEPFAETMLRQAASRDPTHAPTQNNLGLTLQHAGKLDQAETCYREAHRLAPGDGAFLSNQAGVLRLRGALGEATALAQQALGLAPGSPDTWNSWGMLRLDAADTTTARAAFLAAWEKDSSRLDLLSNHAMATLYDPVLASADLRAAAARFGDVLPVPPLPRDARTEPRRIAFLSADFYQHPVGSILAPLLPALQARGCELFFYADGARRDGTSGRIAACGHWRDTARLDDRELAMRIAADRPDALVDLAGHSAGNRQRTLALRPAPLQVSWLGYPGPVGNPALAASLLGRRLLADGAACFFPEPVVAVDAPPLLLPDLPADPPVQPPPALRRRAVTFGSFNNSAKLNDDCLALWARLLATVTDSELFIKHRHGADPRYQAHVRELFAAHGIAGERLRFAGSSAYRDLLASYGEIDIMLDSYPFTGGMTTLEALWMGVPVVSLYGLRPVSRQGLALLEACGLDELTAATPDAWVSAATDLAGNRTALQALRAGLRERLLQSALNDREAAADALLAALRKAATAKRPTEPGETTTA